MVIFPQNYYNACFSIMIYFLLTSKMIYEIILNGEC